MGDRFFEDTVPLLQSRPTRWTWTEARRCCRFRGFAHSTAESAIRDEPHLCFQSGSAVEAHRLCSALSMDRAVILFERPASE
jgi:hypothetical protein